jgi:ATP-dependent Clp protease ATP-binding subunit ClpC
VTIRRQFAALHVDLDEVCAQVRRTLESSGGGHHGYRAPTPEAEAAVTSARRDAVGKVEAPHILLGALRSRDGLPARKLVEAGADLDEVERRLRAMLDDGKWSAAFYRERRSIEQPGLGSTSSVLEDLGRDLTAAAERDELSRSSGASARWWS